MFLRGGESATELLKWNTLGFAVLNKEKEEVVSTEPSGKSFT